MLNSGSYNLTNESQSKEDELKRLMAQIELCWKKEFQILECIGLTNDHSVLEVGSGPGYYTEKLINQWPGAVLTVIETDIDMITLAKENLNQYKNKIHFINGSTYDTGLISESFDFIIARFVFQHLDNPVEAAAELKRLLKPKGKLVIIDIDANLYGIVSPYFKGLEPVYKKHAIAQAKRGGNRLIGRDLWKILTRIGLNNTDIHAYVYHSDETGLDAFDAQICPERFLPLLKEGIIEQEEYDTLVWSFQEFKNTPGAYILMAGLIAVGEKN